VALSDEGRLYSELPFVFICFFSEYKHHREFLRGKKSHFRISNEVFQLFEILLVFGQPTPLIEGPGGTNCKSVFFVFLNLFRTSFVRQEE